MALCAQCKTQETQMYENGLPICLACATDKDVERADAATKRDERRNQEPGLVALLTREWVRSAAVARHPLTTNMGIR